jgi:DNA-binding YbaB/EbfC family protein
MDFKKMMEQAQQMQFKLQELQEKFKEIFVEGVSGGGLVKVVMSCAGIVKTIDIDTSLLVADEKEATEDLIVAAMNNANLAREKRVQQESQSIMGGMGLNPSQLGGM